MQESLVLASKHAASRLLAGFTICASLTTSSSKYCGMHLRQTPNHFLRDMPFVRTKSMSELEFPREILYMRHDTVPKQR